MSEATVDRTSGTTVPPSGPAAEVRDATVDQPALISRRSLLRAGAVGLAVVGAGAGKVLMQPSLERRGLLSTDGVFGAASMAAADALYIEAFPTSPLILHPFTDPLLVPRALTPLTPAQVAALDPPPGPGPGQQNSFRNETHQLWVDAVGLPAPIVYTIDDQVGTHSFTTSQVRPIDDNGDDVQSFDAAGNPVPAGTIRTLPLSTIYGFNAAFPGPLINAEYGKPVLVRFTNRLDENPLNLDRQDFGDPELRALTHLHNGHTAPESDGNPHYAFLFGPKDHGFPVGSFVDQLYLNFPAGFDDREKQSFFWFHDHVMDFTGANVYKGQVGLYPIYDPKNNLDAGDETQGLRLPGVRTNRADGAFDVEFDVPLVAFDVSLDDGRTVHQDFHDTIGEFPAAGNPRTHPEWWGKTFFKHFPNHGFVGDIFTVNGTAYPVWEGEAAQVPAALPGRLGLADLRVRADDVDQRAEVGRLARLRRHGAAGPVPHRGRPAVHAVHRDRDRRRPAAVPDHPQQLRAVAGEAARAHRRLHQVHGRLAHQEGRRHLPDEHHEDDHRADVGHSVAVLARPPVQDPDGQDRHRRRRPGQQRPAGAEHQAA
jgi:FtsP/CotA-like multicopper oxidase with cupredoxin domain